MSVINREPYINKILKLLSKDELADLKDLIDGGGSEPVFRSLIANSPYELTTADYGIKRVNLELPGSGLAQSVYQGYLIYKEDGEAEGTDLCALISYTNDFTQRLSLLIMHKTGPVWGYVFRGCNLTVLELRSELDDISGGSGTGDVSYEEVELDIYYADLDIVGSTFILDNLEKNAILDGLLDKAIAGKVAFSSMTFPEAQYTDLAPINVRSTHCSSFNDEGLGKGAAFTFRFPFGAHDQELSWGIMLTSNLDMELLITGVANEDAAAMLTAMAEDPTKCIHLTYKCEKAEEPAPGPEPEPGEDEDEIEDNTLVLGDSNTIEENTLVIGNNDSIEDNALVLG